VFDRSRKVAPKSVALGKEWWLKTERGIRSWRPYEDFASYPSKVNSTREVLALVLKLPWNARNGTVFVCNGKYLRTYHIDDYVYVRVNDDAIHKNVFVGILEMFVWWLVLMVCLWWNYIVHKGMSHKFYHEWVDRTEKANLPHDLLHRWLCWL